MTYYMIHTIYEPGCEALGKQIESYIKDNGGTVMRSPFILPPVVLCDIPDEMVGEIRERYKVGQIKNGDSGKEV